MKTEVNQAPEETSITLASLVETIPVRVEKVQIAESVTRTVIEKSDTRGESIEQISEDRPFELHLKLNLAAGLRELGFRERASKNTALVLYDREGTLCIRGEHQYEGTEYRSREERVFDYHVSQGEEVAPYCYADSSYDVYKTVTRRDPYPVTRTESVDEALSQEGFDVVYASLLQNANEGGEKSAEALKQLEAAFPDVVAAARANINEVVSEQLRDVELKASSLSQEVQALNNLKLPGAFPDA